jgi:serine/threonine protein phosphatase PrpC
MALALQVVGKTDVGCVRTNNEDNFGYDSRYGIYVVCDGMGGAAAGEVASKLGVDTVLGYFRDAARTGIFPRVGESFEGYSERANALASAIQMANGAIHVMGSTHAAQRGMGSTIVAVLFEGDFFSIGHVGDSRIYLVRHGEIQQLTDDHSLVMEQVRRGLMTREEAERSEMQNIIIRALGSDETVKPDVEDMVAMPGDVLVLASDGLTKHVKDDWMLAIVNDAPTLEQACNDLIDAAKAHGGDDNITCILIKTVQQPWYKMLSRFLPGGGNHKWQNSF